MVSPVLNESRWSGEFLVSEANGQRSRDQVTLKQQSYSPPQVYSQGGTVLGVIGVSTAAPSYAADSGNTGNFTCSAVVEDAGAQQGAYTGVFVNATHYILSDPAGREVGGVTATGVAFAHGQLTFTITVGSTPAVAGDDFTITVGANASAGLYAPLGLNNTDGSQSAAAILFNTIDASAGNTKTTVISRAAEVNGSELTYPAGATANQIAAINAQLAAFGIIVR